MTSSTEIKVPDIGGFTDVSVIDVMVEVGQKIEVDTPLITLETDKAAMDVPAPAAGVVRKVSVKRGDKVSQGSSILLLEVDGASPAAGTAAPTPAPATAPAPPAAAASAVSQTPAQAPAPAAAPVAAASRGPVSIDEVGFSKAHASPSVRKFARELGVDLGRVTGTGPKARISADDVKALVKKLLTSPAATVSALPRVADVDFARFGPVEIKPL